MNTRAIALVVAFCCTVAVHAQKKNPYKDVSGDVRLEAIRRARVWMPSDIASKDLRRGPQGDGAFEPEAVVTCDYIEKKQRGTPKFDCAMGEDELRVKYGERNGEVYSEVASSRLLWALGFGADRMYPVKVVCNGCPADPIKDHKKKNGTREFAAAVVERKFRGDAMDFRNQSGWEWVELNFVDPTRGGAPLAHRDALKLLAAMIQHTDNKFEQQRLVCLDRERGMQPHDDGSCEHPFMIVQDLGKTFGRASFSNADTPSAVNLKEWSNVPVWKNDTGCVAYLPQSFTGSLEHPAISEDGRQFLADLLAKLTDAQLRDMFQVARFTQRDPHTSIDGWVQAFKDKRDEIANRRCSNPGF
jgi:hypothetical protein